jgi:thiamine-monophosphate kinase
MPSVGSIGEFGLIARLKRVVPSAPSVIEGIGDDCAVVRAGDRILLATCDLSLENVHWRRDDASPESIGYKAAASALSDIAAMGGSPLFCLVSLACPGDTEVAFIDGLYDGLLDAAAQCGAAVVGGDTTRSAEGVILDVMAIGEPAGRYVTRKGAAAGDRLAVTGRLGLAAAGLHALEGGVAAPDLVHAHYHPAPRFPEGLWLSACPEVHAMIDISDGLLQDAGHLAEAAGLGVDIDRNRLPVDPRLAAYCAKQGVSPYDFILSGGEDYELAFAVVAEGVDGLVEAFRRQFQTEVSVVGVFEGGFREVRVSGSVAGKGGFDHFRREGGIP